MNPATCEPGVWKTPEQHCFECGHTLNAVASAAGDGAEPARDGTGVTVCLECGAIYALDAELRIRELTLGERAEMAGDHDLMGRFRAIHRGAPFARRKPTVH